MAFLLKKLIAGILAPVPLAAELLVAGLLVGRFTRRAGLGRGLVVAGTAVLLAFGYAWAPALLLEPLEARYPAYTPPPVAPSRPTAIVVLGRAFSPPVAALPFTSQIDDVLMARLMEAVRVYRLLPEARIIVSLSGDAPAADKQRFLDQFAALTGIDPGRLALVGGARDTEEEARAACALAPAEALVLVTSAAHMPRAMRVFRRLGVTPVPAPGVHRLRPHVDAQAFSAGRLFPSPEALRDADEALHEYVGLAWDWVSACWRQPPPAVGTSGG
jgi:uncharacterized SAM-binding protein YcdF (DUF218 family)